MKHVELACHIILTITGLGKNRRTDRDGQSVNGYVSTKEIYDALISFYKYTDVSRSEVDEILDLMWSESILTKKCASNIDTRKLRDEKSPLLHEKTREITDDTGWIVAINGKNGVFST